MTMSAAVSHADDPTIDPCTGPVHFSALKRIGDSGRQYLEALKGGKSTPAQMLGTAVHTMVLGARSGEGVVCYAGRRAGKEWDAFALANRHATILNETEWCKAEAIASAVLADPVAQDYMAGARFEVPLTWQDGDVTCATSGIDIVQPARIGDLKTATSTHIERFQRQAFGFSYHCQLAWYRRGAIANGLDVSGGVFVVAVETVPPYEVVVHELSEDLIDLGERTIALWLERLRVYRTCNAWPGRAQTAVTWSVPSWMVGKDEGEEEVDDEQSAAE
jgi:hypothetical protein